MKTPLLNHKREDASWRAKWGVALVFIFLIGAMFSFSSRRISETSLGETHINVLKKVCLMFAGEKYCASKADIDGMDTKRSLRYEMIGHGPCITDGRILMSRVEGGVEKCMAKCDNNDECRAITFVQGGAQNKLNFNCESILGTYKLSQEPEDPEINSICFKRVKSSSEGIEGDEARVLVTEEFSDGDGPPSSRVMNHLKSVVKQIVEEGGLNDPPKSESESPPVTHHIAESPSPPVDMPPEAMEEIIPQILSSILSPSGVDPETDSDPVRIHIRAMDPPPPSSPHQSMIPGRDSEPESEPVRIHIGSIDPPPPNSLPHPIPPILPLPALDSEPDSEPVRIHIGSMEPPLASSPPQPMIPPMLPMSPLDDEAESEPVRIHIGSMGPILPIDEPIPQPGPIHVVHVKSDPTLSDPTTVLHHMQVINPPQSPPEPPTMIHQTHVIPPKDDSVPLQIVHKTHVIHHPPPETEPMKVIHHTPPKPEPIHMIHLVETKPPKPIHMIHLVETKPPKTKPPQVVHVIHAEPPPPPSKPQWATIQTRGDVKKSSGKDTNDSKTTTTTPALVKKGKYEKKDSGKMCNKGRIATEKECEAAAKELGHKFSGIIDEEKKPPGCNYNGGEIRFNKNAKATGSDDSYDEICIV